MNAKKRSAKKRSSRKMKSLKKKSSAKKRSAKKRLSKKMKSLKRNSSAKKRSAKKRLSKKMKSLKKKSSAKKRYAKKRSSRKMKSLKKKSSAKKRYAKKRSSRKMKSLKKKSSAKKIGGAAKKSPEEKEREKEQKKKQKEREKEQKKKQKELEKEQKKKQKEIEKEQKKKQKEIEKEQKKKQKEIEKEQKKKQKELEKKQTKELNNKLEKKVTTAVIQNDYNPDTFSPMLAHKYNGEDPVGYCVSEKLDGYRAILSENGFMSRNNNLFNAPKEYIKDILDKLPKGIVLDGELYTKRGDFAGMGVVRKKVPIKSEWEKITYMVFDLPLVQEPFYKRYEMMQKLLIDVPHVKLVECNIINSLEEFEKTHSELIKSGAEGSMLRNIHAYYKSSRTRDLLKVKDAFDDEVEVIDIENGEGKYRNVMGKLIVKWSKESGKNTNVQFDVGSGFSDEDRQNAKKLFKPGTLITIKYWEITPSGKPRFPIYERIRHLE